MRFLGSRRILLYGFRSEPPSPYLPLVQTYIAYIENTLGLPMSEIEKTAINTFWQTVLDNGMNEDDFDRVWPVSPAGRDAGETDLINPGNSTRFESGVVNYNADGFTMDGTTGVYIFGNWVPVFNAVNFKLNDNSIMFCYKEPAGGKIALFGCGSQADDIFMLYKDGSDVFEGYDQDSLTATSYSAPSIPSGVFGINRTSSEKNQLWFAEDYVVDTNNTESLATVLTSDMLIIGAWNDGGSVGYEMSGTFQGGWIGRGFSDEEMTVLVDAFTLYNQSLGRL